MKLNELDLPAGWSFPRMINADCYTNYYPHHRPDEVLQFMASVHWTGWLDKNLPKTEGLKPIHDFAKQMESVYGVILDRVEEHNLVAEAELERTQLYA